MFRNIYSRFRSAPLHQYASPSVSFNISVILELFITYAWALITGSSDGIGKAFAIELASEYGFNVVIHGRNNEKLERVRREIIEKSAAKGKKIEVKIIVADTSKAHALDYQSLFVAPLSSLPLTLLINNVGVMCEKGSDIPYASSSSFSDADVISIINTNTLFLSLLTKNLLPLLSAHKRPSLIVNISSTLSLYTMPYITYYSASKAYLNAFSDVLNRELALDPITRFVRCESLIVGSVNTGSNNIPVSYMNPSADTYAQSACRVIGDGTKNGTGYLGHAIEILILWVIPEWLSNSLIAKSAQMKKLEYEKSQ